MREINQKNTKKDPPNHDTVTVKKDTIVENCTRKINVTGNCTGTKVMPKYQLR